MGANDTDVIRWANEEARAGPWRGDLRVAYLRPLGQGPPLSASFVRWAMGELSARGFTKVVTNALCPDEQLGFLKAGFQVRERLHLLQHDLRQVPRHVSPGGHRRLRPATPADRQAVLQVDTEAFTPFWRFDGAGLDETLAATPRSRFRLGDGDSGVVAYAVTGRWRRRGFVQRVAVRPWYQRRGWGRALVVDGLRWLRRWRVRNVVVNTPSDNLAALALYEDVGFRRHPSGLDVLAVELDG